MKNWFLLSLFFFITTAVSAQPEYKIDLANWKLELPSGYTASEWKLSNFEKDRFASPFFYVDPEDSAFILEAYPVKGSSTAKYTKSTLREQMKPGSSSVNWTLVQGGVLESEFQVVEMSKDDRGDFHETILFQIQGRTNDEQTDKLGLEKSTGPPLLKVYWVDGKIRVVRKVLKEWDTVGEALLMKESWEDDRAKSFKKPVNFQKAEIKIIAQEDRIEIKLDDQKPVVFKDSNIKQWYFENYFVAGNYLQSKDEGAHSIVKFFSLNVTHEE